MITLPLHLVIVGDITVPFTGSMLTNCQEDTIYNLYCMDTKIIITAMINSINPKGLDDFMGDIIKSTIALT